MAYDKRMKELPLFISFPRCGSHWINAVAEIYFNRPRLREGRTTFLPNSRIDWMWFHDHDLELNINHDNVIYLYRNPVDVLFSDSMAEKGEVNFKFIKSRADLYKKHLLKYLVNIPAKSIIKYENFIIDFNKEFQKVVNFFGGSYDEIKINNAKKIVTKEALINRSKDKKFINNKLIDIKYKETRKVFVKENKDWINELVIIKELNDFFKEI